MPVSVAGSVAPVDRRTPLFHDSVDHLVADESLSRQQKIKTLMRWQHEAKVREMQGLGSRKEQLTLILQALHKLEANEFV